MTMDVWGFASALSDAVKKTSQELTDTLRNTEWKNEFADIRKEIEEDTSEIATNAKSFTDELSKRTAKVVEQTGIQEAVGLNLSRPNGDGEKSRILTETNKKVYALSKKFLDGTSQTYDNLSRAFQQELGLETKKDAKEEYKHFSRADVAIKELQKSEKTFTDNPEDEESFADWKRDANNMKSVDTDMLLTESVVLQDMFRALVPEICSSDEFWTRYLYKLHKLEEKHLLIARAAERSHATESQEADWDNAWDDEDDIEESSSVANNEQDAELEGAARVNSCSSAGVGDSSPKKTDENLVASEDAKEDHHQNLLGMNDVQNPPATDGDADEDSPWTDVESSSLAQSDSVKPSETHDETDDGWEDDVTTWE
jgi:hypothetical protein